MLTLVNIIGLALANLLLITQEIFSTLEENNLDQSHHQKM
jgi:hypothetical protein